MKILLFTATGAYNLGDECILKSEVSSLHEYFPECEITVCTYDVRSSEALGKNKVDYIAYFPLGMRKNPWKNITYLFRNILALLRSDLVIIGGGGLFFDDGNERSLRSRLRQWQFRVWMARLSRRPILFLGISIDTVSLRAERELSSIFIGKRSEILLRDQGSLALLESLGGKGKVSCDSAIGMRLYHSSSGEDTEGKPIVGIALRKGYLKEEERMIRGMVEMIRSAGYTPLCISHSLHPDKGDENDFLSFRKIAEELDVPITKSLEESKEAYTRISYMIAIRLHGAILSVNHDIPFILLSYGQKTREFARSLEYTYVLEAREFDLAIWKDMFLSMLSNEDQIKKDLESRREKMKLQYQKDLRDALVRLGFDPRSPR